MSFPFLVLEGFHLTSNVSASYSLGKVTGILPLDALNSVFDASHHAHLASYVPYYHHRLYGLLVVYENHDSPRNYPPNLTIDNLGYYTFRLVCAEHCYGRAI